MQTVDNSVGEIVDAMHRQVLEQKAAEYRAGDTMIQAGGAMVVRRPEVSINELLRVAKLLAESNYFANANTQAKAYAKIQAGAELGIPPFAAMQGIDVINGKTVLSATLIATLIQNSPRFSYRVRERSNEACAIEFFDHGESLGVERFTMEDARRASLAGKDNWRNYPKSMLFARAMRQGAITYCPAVFAGGAVYTEEEAAGIIDVTTQEPVVQPATAEQKQAIAGWFREQKMRGPQISDWLEEHRFPGPSAMTFAQAEEALAVIAGPVIVEAQENMSPAGTTYSEPAEAEAPPA